MCVNMICFLQWDGSLRKCRGATLADGSLAAVSITKENPFAADIVRAMKDTSDGDVRKRSRRTINVIGTWNPGHLPRPLDWSSGAETSGKR